MISIIEVRFEKPSDTLEKKIRGITDEVLLLKIQKLALEASTLEEFEIAIDKQSK